MTDWVDEKARVSDERLGHLLIMATTLRVAGKGWQLETLNADAKKYGAFVYQPMWGAVAVCPRESPQFSAHAYNMRHIQAFNPNTAADLCEDLIDARASLREAEARGWKEVLRLNELEREQTAMARAALAAAQAAYARLTEKMKHCEEVLGRINPSIDQLTLPENYSAADKHMDQVSRAGIKTMISEMILAYKTRALKEQPE